MRKILYLDPMRTELSRTKELFQFLKFNHGNIKKLKITTKSRFAYIILALKFLRHIVLQGRTETYVIPFSAKPMGLIMLIFVPFLIFYRKRIIFDMGYPFSDIPDKSRLSRVLMRISELSLCSISSVVLWESSQSALVNGLRLNTNVIWYCVPSFMSNYDDNINKGIEPKSKTMRLLFRGNMNPESGIAEFISLFVKQPVWKEKSLKLVLQGKNASEAVRELVNSSEQIELISKFLSETELAKLIDECDIMIGQYGTGFKRLDTTIPHKLFEAIWSEKPYMSPAHAPLEVFGQRVMCELRRINDNLHNQSLTTEKLQRFIEFWIDTQVAETARLKIIRQNDRLLQYVR